MPSDPPILETAAHAPAWTAADLRSNPHAAPDKADRVQRMFSAIAQRYDVNNRLHSFGRDQAWRRAAIRMCGARQADEVLDVACGTGDLTLLFAKASVKRVVGLDFTEPMLRIARRKCHGLTGASGATAPSFVQGDALALPFPDRSFDVVSIAFGLRNVSDPGRALREFHRVLRPGGRVLVLEFSEPRNAIIRRINRLYCAHIMPRTAALIAGDRSGAYRYLPQSVTTFPGPDGLRQMMRDAGFVDVRHTPLTFGVCTASLGHVS